MDVLHRAILSGLVKECYMSSFTERDAMAIKVDGKTPIITIISISEIAKTLEAIGVATSGRSSGSVQKVNRTMDK